jgi:DNA-binding CsgD family transcriptional regulator/quercetin dioxygenase-like cupin family protein
MQLIESPTGLAALGSDAPGIVVIDHARRIVFKNACAEALLASGAAISERRHALTSGAPSVEASLQAALRAAAAGPERHGGAPCLLSVPRARALPLMGLIVALPGAIDDLAALALLWDPQAAPLLPSGALAQMFGLTPAEMQIALATYEGLTPVEVALARGRSVATVRTLLSRVFMKCGVRRQAELVKLLAGIANACSMAHGIRVGLDMQRTGADANPYRRAAVHHLHDVVARELTQARDMHATVHMIDFAPGQATQPHYHTHGHEILCVMHGNLTTEFGSGQVHTTQPGQARYVPERVLHRGVNPAASGNVQVLSINVARRGSAFRVEQAGLAPAH